MIEARAIMSDRTLSRRLTDCHLGSTIRKEDKVSDAREG